MLVVHVLGVLLGLVLGLLAVDVVHALGLSELVNFSAGKSSEKLLGELVRDRLACFDLSVVLRTRDVVALTFAALMVLECLEGGEGGTSSNHLMTQAGLVVILVVIAVALVVRVVRFT